MENNINIYNVVKPSEKTILYSHGKTFLYPLIKPIFICRGECMKCIDKYCLTI